MEGIEFPQKVVRVQLYDRHCTYKFSETILKARVSNDSQKFPMYAFALHVRHNIIKIPLSSPVTVEEF